MTIALAGDTMLGRRVAERFDEVSPDRLVAPEVAALCRRADLTVVNLECCISTRGDPWPDPRKPFFFRAPPVAVETLRHLGVDAVTVANNHALDFGRTALLDTLEHLQEAGIAVVGAGADLDAARRPVHLDVDGLRVALVAATDHPRDYAAGSDRPGVAYADLHREVPDWLAAEVTLAAATADAVLVTPHWGPNMTTAPLRHVREAADRLLDAGATLIAGHSAHVFHGVRLTAGRAVAYDLGDFIDDYVRDPALRNDLGLLWLVTVGAGEVLRLEAVPLRLRFAYTELADGDDRAWIVRRLREASAPFGTHVEDAGDRLVLLPETPDG